MSKHIVAAIALLLTLSACKSKDAFKFSEDIVAKERSLKDDITRTETEVENYIKYELNDSIAAVSERMESLVNDKLEEIKAMKTPSAKGADEFKDAAIKYFEFMKSLYTSYKNYGKAATDEEKSKVVAEMQEILNKKDNAINDMQNAQRKYAKANGFRLEK
ncbi:MAG TPA: hypothetical protein VF476_03450 [Chitinophagaceae bacterium]